MYIGTHSLGLLRGHGDSPFRALSPGPEGSEQARLHSPPSPALRRGDFHARRPDGRCHQVVRDGRLNNRGKDGLWL